MASRLLLPVAIGAFLAAIAVQTAPDLSQPFLCFFCYKVTSDKQKSNIYVT